MVAVDTYKNKAKVCFTDLCKFLQLCLPLITKEMTDLRLRGGTVQNCIPWTKK